MAEMAALLAGTGALVDCAGAHAWFAAIVFVVEDSRAASMPVQVSLAPHCALLQVANLGLECTKVHTQMHPSVTDRCKRGSVSLELLVPLQQTYKGQLYKPGSVSVSRGHLSVVLMVFCTPSLRWMHTPAGRLCDLRKRPLRFSEPVLPSLILLCASTPLLRNVVCAADPAHGAGGRFQRGVDKVSAAAVRSVCYQEKAVTFSLPLPDPLHDTLVRRPWARGMHLTADVERGDVHLAYVVIARVVGEASWVHASLGPHLLSGQQ
ncbi:MAG TPA: hypothetical protein VGF67_09845 [Ktedonobacteraceae bacterium]